MKQFNNPLSAPVYIILFTMVSLITITACDDNPVTTQNDEPISNPEFVYKITGDLSLEESHTEYSLNYSDSYVYSISNQRSFNSVTTGGYNVISLVTSAETVTLKKWVILDLELSNELIREREYQLADAVRVPDYGGDYNGVFGISLKYYEDLYDESGSFLSRITEKEYLSSFANGQVTITKFNRSMLQGEIQATLVSSDSPEKTVSITSTFTIDLLAEYEN